MSTVAAPRAAAVGPVRDWLRATTSVASLCGTDDGLSQPSVYAHNLGSGAEMPAVVVTKVGLSPDGTVTERHLLQFDCWASKAQGAGEAEALAAAVKTALETDLPATSDGVRLWGASIEAEVALPDPDDGQPRYVVTALVTTSVVA